ncbi:MAG TPA: hypothetical protein VD884_10575 [Ohtaekwangia sp.]|nr:hypothetical protein [Ohtaekwangia sp.]
MIGSRLKGSSLIEVTVALVIITLVFSLAMVIYLNVQRSGLYAFKLSCEMMLNEVYTNTVRSEDYQNKEVTYDEVFIYQEVKTYPGSGNLLLITLEAREPGGKMIAERKHLVYVPDKP